MPHDGTELEPEPSADDFGAAEESLARLRPLLGRDTPEYRDIRQALARFGARYGKDRSDLRNGVRLPKNSEEQAAADLFQGRMTEEQFREVVKADAERPVDIALLDVFCGACEAQLRAYGRMIQTIIEIATDQREPDAWRRREAEVGRHVEEMRKELPLR